MILFINLGTGFSSHWVPYWRECSPCQIDYDMIGKLETGFDDFTVSFILFLFVCILCTYIQLIYTLQIEK